MTTTRWLFKPARESVYYYWSVVSCICLNVMAAGDIYESSNHIGESGKSVCCARFPFRIASTLAFYIHKKEADSKQMPHTIAIVLSIFGTFWKLRVHSWRSR